MVIRTVALLGAAAALACDITGWPSTTHRPVEPQAVAAAELSVEYVPPVRPADDEIRAARAALVAALGQHGIEAARAPDGASFLVWFPGVVPDWALVDEAVRTVSPEARRGTARVAICLRDQALPDGLARDVRALARGAAGAAEIGEDAVTVTFPHHAPPDSALLWRLRRLLAQS